MLSLQVSFETQVNIVIQKWTFGNEGIDLLFCNLPRDSVNEQRVLDSVKLGKHGIEFILGPVQDLHINVYQVVHLRYGHDVKMLMNEKQLHFMVFGWIFQTIDKNVHNFEIYIISRHISQVDLQSYFESIILKRNLK